MKDRCWHFDGVGVGWYCGHCVEDMQHKTTMSFIKFGIVVFVVAFVIGVSI